MREATNVDFVVAVNTKAGCYGVGETAKQAIVNCNRERSRFTAKTKPTVFYYFGGCARSEIKISCGVGLEIQWPKTATVMRTEIKE